MFNHVLTIFMFLKIHQSFVYQLMLVPEFSMSIIEISSIYIYRYIDILEYTQACYGICNTDVVSGALSTSC